MEVATPQRKRASSELDVERSEKKAEKKSEKKAKKAARKELKKNKKAEKKEDKKSRKTKNDHNAHMYKDELQERSNCLERPAIGDVVEILDTPYIRKVLPTSIGQKVTISFDDASAHPYRVCRDRSEAPYALHPGDVRLLVKATCAASIKPRRILEISGDRLKIVCSDSMAFVNFHRALQTCIQACKGNANAAQFRFEFNGNNISSDRQEDMSFLSELKVGDVLTYTSVFNRSYGKHKPMQLTVVGACTMQTSPSETPWTRLKFLDDDLLPRCIQATSEKTRDTANWKLCHMRFDRVLDLGEFEKDDSEMMRSGPDYTSFGRVFQSSLRRRGPGKHRREAIVQRMGLDLAGELDVAKASDDKLSDVAIKR